MQEEQEEARTAVTSTGCGLRGLYEAYLERQSFQVLKWKFQTYLFSKQEPYDHHIVFLASSFLLFLSHPSDTLTKRRLFVFSEILLIRILTPFVNGQRGFGPFSQKPFLQEIGIKYHLIKIKERRALSISIPLILACPYYFVNICLSCTQLTQKRQNRAREHLHNKKTRHLKVGQPTNLLNKLRSGFHNSTNKLSLLCPTAS